LALLNFEMRQFDLAIRDFLILLDRNAGDDRLRYLLATAYAEKGDRKSALEEYRKVSAYSELFVNARIQMALILKKDGQLPEAIDVIKDSMARKKDQVPFYIYLSSLYDENKDLAAAENVLLAGIKIFPQNVDLRYSLGVIYEKTNRFAQSIREMEIILSIDPDHADALNFIGYSWADRGINLQEAEKLILRALELKPGNGYIIDSLGWVYFKQNKLDSALKHLKEAMRLMPNDATIIEHVGDVYLKMENYKEAQEMYENALKINPQNKSLQKKLEDLKERKTINK